MIKENNISYTPEKIDEFVAQLTKEVESAKNIFSVALNKVKDLSVGSITDNPSFAEGYLEKIKAANEIINKKHSKYFDIVDLYDVGDYPNNVKQLENLTDTLNNYYYDIMRIEDALEETISASKKLTNFYNQEQI